MTAYYNENDPGAAAWLRELIRSGLIAPGEVDESDIRDVVPGDLRGFTQCHFFAGIGVWSYALRQAGWSDDRPVWTGSCPCQPFSQAGKGNGTSDERHLWPYWFHLIEVCRPGIVFGEQVASKAGLGWLDLVQADLEGAGYASGAIDLCAAGVGAPHIRQRLWFVAERVGYSSSQRSRWNTRAVLGTEEKDKGERGAIGDSFDQSQFASTDGRMAKPNSRGPAPRSEATTATRYRDPSDPESGSDRYGPTGPTNGFWRDADWLFCRDGKWRPVIAAPEQMVAGVTSDLVRLCNSCGGYFSPLEEKAPARITRLRGYGNALTAPVASAFISAYLDVRKPY